MILRNIGMVTSVNILKGIISLLLSFYVAKAVSPSEFGLIAFAIPLATLITLLTDLGIANAVVRERSLTKVQSGSAMGLMIGFGLLGGAGLALLATPIQWASGLPGVHDVVLGFAFVTCFSVWATCPRALVERELQYNTISAVELSAVVAATCVFFVAFRFGWGIFALVAFHITLQCVRSLIFLWCARHFFTWVLIPRGVAPLLQTGGWIFASNLLSYSSRNFDRFIIGANLGATAVGMYGFAYQFMTVPLVLLAWPASGVLMSTLSRLDDNFAAKKRVVVGFLAITVAVVFPMMALISLHSAYPLSTFLSESWRGVDRYITLLAPLGALQALAVYGTATLVADGKVKLSFKLSVLNGLFIPAGFLFSVAHGLTTAIFTYIISSTAICCLVIYYMCKSAQISLFELPKILMPGTIAAVLVTLAHLLQPSIFDNSTLNWAFTLFTSIMLAAFGLLFFQKQLFQALRELSSTRVPKASEATT